MGNVSEKENKKIEKKEMILVDETIIRDKIYVGRGQKVMLDMDLAEIYGYTTKAFNQQVKNNVERFDEDFRFQLTLDEYENLRSKNLTSSWGGVRYLPYAFTDQGIYMLMTVLKGELAVRQSKALIRIFKRMKDYILENRGLIGTKEFLDLSMQVSYNTIRTNELQTDLAEVQNQIAEVVENLNEMVSYSELAEYMSEFGDPHIKSGYLIYNGQPFRSDYIFSEIYGYAKKSIILFIQII